MIEGHRYRCDGLVPAGFVLIPHHTNELSAHTAAITLFARTPLLTSMAVDTPQDFPNSIQQ